MKFNSILFALLIGTTAAMAQKTDKKAMDRESIKSMAGCHKVSFDFAETFSPDTAYEYRDRYHASAIEYVFVLNDQPDLIQLQHLLVVNDTMIVKHWRQDWVYEENELLTYKGENKWETITYSPEETSGTWTQKVYQVDDSPRYESKGTWVHVDGKHYWEGTAYSPLPRREITKRSDYNVMKRNSRMELTEDGWFLEQDNEKILMTNEGEKLISHEKGMEVFTTGDYNCQPGIDWWEENHKYWEGVRLAWNEVFDENQTIKIEKRIDNQMLWQKLFAAGDEAIKADKAPSTKESKEKAKAIIMEYVNA